MQEKLEKTLCFSFCCRYAMNCRLRRQENREKLENQVKLHFTSFCFNFQSIGLANQTLPNFSIFFCFLGDIRQLFMAYQQQKSRFYRAEPTKPRFFFHFFFRYAMTCRMRRQENRENLEQQVRSNSIY